MAYRKHANAERTGVHALVKREPYVADLIVIGGGEEDADRVRRGIEVGCWRGPLRHRGVVRALLGWTQVLLLS